MSTTPTPAARRTVSTSDLVELWVARTAGVDVSADLASLRTTSGSRRSAADIDALLAGLDGTPAEAQLWWQLICGWPHGFPPHPSVTPADRYPLEVTSR
jgi:hypothetical protein